MTSQFGSKIIDHFTNPGRGANAGRNDHGVPVSFVLVSMEEEAHWDSSVESLRANNRFPVAGIDLASNRMAAIRAAISHFRGEASTPEPNTLPFAQRRRIVILNMLPNAAGLSLREILHNALPQDSGALSASDEAAIKAAINRVEPGVILPDNDSDGDPDGTDPDDDNDGVRDVDEITLGLDPFKRDSDGDGIGDGEEDPDGDGFTNVQELDLLGTDPLEFASRFDFRVEDGSGGLTINFATRVGRRYTVERSADGIRFEPAVVLEGSGAVVSPQLGLPGNGQLYRVRIELLPP